MDMSVPSFGSNISNTIFHNNACKDKIIEGFIIDGKMIEGEGDSPTTVIGFIVIRDRYCINSLLLNMTCHYLIFNLLLWFNLLFIVGSNANSLTWFPIKVVVAAV